MCDLLTTFELWFKAVMGPTAACDYFPLGGHLTLGVVYEVTQDDLS